VHISYVYDIDSPSPYAAGIQILSTCRALCDHGAAVTVYTGRLRRPTMEACLAFYGLTPHPRLRVVPFFGGGWGRLRAEARLRDLQGGRPDGEGHFIISRGETGLKVFEWLRKRQRLPGERRLYEAHRLCFTEVGAGGRWVGRQGRWAAWWTGRVREMERRTVEATDGLICLTRGVEAALREAFDVSAPVLILPSGTAPAAVTEVRRAIDILYAGKLERRKGLHVLIEAMRLLPGRRLTIVGGTDEQIAEWRRQAGAMGVAEQIDFVGFVEPAQMRGWYARARVGVCPLPKGESRIAEEFTSPLKVLDMISAGTPIVGTEVPALTQLIDNEETGLLVAPSDATALAE
jgi:glycosyltransferase involved in cell wall biosynthesis